MPVQTSPNGHNGCPGREELLALHLGKLSQEALESLARHLNGCEQCLTSLDGLSHETDPLLDGLRLPAEPQPSGDAESERAIRIVESLTLHLRETISLHQDQQSTDQAPAADAPLASASQTAFELGRLGQYQLLERLGEGGMGLVFKARHLLMNRVVALKVIHRRHFDHPAAIQRFFREIRALAQLDHPNIVRAHDANEVDDTHFLVMEYVEGVPLSKWIRQQGPLPVGQACDYIRQAAVGLQHAAENGLVHRDIKPSNLIRTAGGQVKILDLGLALFQEDQTVTEELTATGQMMGTVDYMAPEQWEDTHAVDIRADIYSLGCTLYHLLAGHPPFPAPQYNTVHKKMRAHAEVPVPDLKQVRPDVPDALAAVINRMLAKDPAQRYATPAEVSAALHPFTVAETVPGLPPKVAAIPGPISPALLMETTATAPGQAGAARQGGNDLRGYREGRQPRRRRRLAVLALAASTLGLLVMAALWQSGALLERHPGKEVADATRMKNPDTEQQALPGHPLAMKQAPLHPGEKSLAMQAAHPLGQEDPQPPAALVQLAEKPRITELRVSHYRGQPSVNLGDLGSPGSSATRYNDDLKVHAKLSVPAYCYLLAFNADGKVQLCHPQQENEEPKKTDVIDYPAPGYLFALTDGVGSQAFVLAASHQPLPPYEQWRARVGAAPWQARVDTQGVWRFTWSEGEDAKVVQRGMVRGGPRKRIDVGEVAAVFSPLPQPGSTGIPWCALGWFTRPSPREQLFQFFQGRPEFDTVEVVVFPVLE